MERPNIEFTLKIRDDYQTILEVSVREQSSGDAIEHLRRRVLEELNRIAVGGYFDV